MASIFQRGKRGVWWIKYYVAGEQVYHSLKTTNARVAKKAKRQIEGEEVKGELIAPSKTPLPEFLEDYCGFLSTIRTGKSYKNDISLLRILFGPICPALKPGNCVNKRWKSTKPSQVRDIMKGTHIQGKLLEDLTTAQIEDFVSHRIQRHGIAPKTANHLRGALHRMFNYAIKKWKFVAQDRRNPNPAAAVERRTEPAPTIRFLKLADIEEQFATLEDRPTLYAMVAMYIYAGLRREAGLWLTKEDVDLKRRLIHVRAKTIDGRFWQPKTKHNRVVPISRALMAILTQYSPNRIAPWFFPSPTGRRWDPDNFSQALRESNREHGLKWSCLDFRHTFGSHLAIKGESLYKISTLMGNSPDICRKHYATLIPEQMQDTVEFEKGASHVEAARAETITRLENVLARVDRIKLDGQGRVQPKLRLVR